MIGWYIRVNNMKHTSVMSYTILLTGCSSELKAIYFPEILLEGPTEVGLLNFSTFFSVNNLGKCNVTVGKRTSITVQPGCYGLSDLEATINSELKHESISIRANTVNHKVLLTCTEDFILDQEISNLLGFTQTSFSKNKLYSSDKIVNILPLNLINIEVNIAKGSFLNEKAGKSIYAFIPSEVPHGFRINQTPDTVIYYPVITNSISELSLRITDQSGELIDFQGEQITVRLHFRPISS